jgi:hypothetical protein
MALRMTACSSIDLETSTALLCTLMKPTTVTPGSSGLEGDSTWEIHSLLFESWKNIGL